MFKSYRFYIFFSLIISQLVGCGPAAVVTAPVSLSDKRSAEIQFYDQKIEINAILKTKDIDEDSNLSFLSFNQTVLITGEVRSQKIIEEVIDIVSSFKNVKNVKNYSSVQDQNSSIQSRAEDVLITTNVKSRLFLKENETKLSPLHVKVYTERQNVYLLGILNNKEAESAIKIAKSSRGVKKVVPLFEIIN